MVLSNEINYRPGLKHVAGDTGIFELNECCISVPRERESILSCDVLIQTFLDDVRKKSNSDRNFILQGDNIILFRNKSQLLLKLNISKLGRLLRIIFAILDSTNVPFEQLNFLKEHAYLNCVNLLKDKRVLLSRGTKKVFCC